MRSYRNVCKPVPDYVKQIIEMCYNLIQGLGSCHTSDLLKAELGVLTCKLS